MQVKIYQSASWLGPILFEMQVCFLWSNPRPIVCSKHTLYIHMYTVKGIYWHIVYWIIFQDECRYVHCTFYKKEPMLKCILLYISCHLSLKIWIQMSKYCFLIGQHLNLDSLSYIFITAGIFFMSVLKNESKFKCRPIK